MAAPSNRVRKPFKKAKRLCKKVEDILKLVPFSTSEGGETKITISKVAVGGSVAHGTAVPGHFDIDLVAFSPSILPTKMRINEEQYDYILDQMKKHLKKSLIHHYTPNNFEYFLHGWHFESWHFSIDLQLSPQWERPDLEDMYDFLQGMKKDYQTLFSCGATKFQTQLLQSQPHHVKVLIKRIKKWRNTNWPLSDDAGCPKSYFLSLLVIISYHRIQPESAGIKRLRTLAKRMTTDIKKLVRSIPGDQNLDLRVPGENPIIKRKYERFLPDKPRIIDPANPFRNFYKNKGLCPIKPQKEDKPEKRWAIFAKKISSLNLIMDLT